MKLWVAALLGVALAGATPLPGRERIEQQAELFPDSGDGAPSRDSEGTGRQFPTIFIRPISFEDIFPSRRDSFLQTFSRPSRPSFPFSDDAVIDVPARGSKDKDAVPAESDSSTPQRNPLRNIFDDLYALQRDVFESLLRPLVTPQGPNTRRPALFAPLPPSEDRRRPFPPPEDKPRPSSSLPSFFDSLFSGFPDVPSFLGAGHPTKDAPGFEEFPDDYSNTTYREKEVDGGVLQINETVKKQKHPFGESVFHVKVYNLKPDGKGQKDVKPEQKPEGEGKAVEDKPEHEPLKPEQEIQKPEQPRQPEEKPQQPEAQRPQPEQEAEVPIQPVDKEQDPSRPSVINEPKEERPALKEDFGLIVNDGKGFEEQVPVDTSAGGDDTFNEIL